MGIFAFLIVPLFESLVSAIRIVEIVAPVEKSLPSLIIRVGKENISLSDAPIKYVIDFVVY